MISYIYISSTCFAFKYNILYTFGEKIVMGFFIVFIELHIFLYSPPSFPLTVYPFLGSPHSQLTKEILSFSSSPVDSYWIVMIFIAYPQIMTNIRNKTSIIIDTTISEIQAYVIQKRLFCGNLGVVLYHLKRNVR